MAHFHDFHAASRLARALGGHQTATAPVSSDQVLTELANTTNPEARAILANQVLRNRSRSTLDPQVVSCAEGIVEECLARTRVPGQALPALTGGGAVDGALDFFEGAVDAADTLGKTLYSLAHLEVTTVDPGDGAWDVTVATRILSDLDHLKPWVDPRGWDDCSEFFVVSDPLAVPPPALPHGTPWAGPLLEKAGWVVDLGLGSLNLLLSNILSIDFAVSAQDARANYALQESLDGNMTINEGHFLAAAAPGQAWCRVEARKLVKFVNPLLAAAVPVLLEPFLIDQVVRVLNSCANRNA